MEEQGVDEGPVRVAGGRVHDDARRLVHDDQVLVFVHDLKREVLGEGVDDARRGDGDAQVIACVDAGA